MNITETLLKNLNAGELQQLACEILSKMNDTWSVMSQTGGCEGGFRTRKGTPDMWCIDKDKNYIFIQATADAKKGKIFDDVKKSVDKLVKIKKNRNALCISFLNFDPDIEEIEECINYCKNHNCTYKHYNNKNISNLIDTKYPEIKINFSKLNFNENIAKIQLLNGSFINQIEYILNKINWINEKIIKYFAFVLKELAKNSFEHGNATKVNLIIQNNKIKFIDNGTRFNLFIYDGECTNTGGGKYTLNYFLKNYGSYMNYYYAFIENENVLSFDFKKNIKCNLIVDNDCSIDIPKSNYLDAQKTDYIFCIPKHCNIIKLRVTDYYTMLSDFGYIINKIIQSIPKTHKVEIVINKDNSDFITGYFKDCLFIDSNRVYLKEIP